MTPPQNESEESITAIWRETLELIRDLPLRGQLSDLFDFDVRQFYSANQYSELVTDLPSLASVAENRAYVPHNMGILIVGTIDLMASPGTRLSELGVIRAFLHKAQILARLMNVLVTSERETREGDSTSELLARASEPGWTLKSARAALKAEVQTLFSELRLQAPRIASFDAHAYVDGLQDLQSLHLEMKGVI